MQQNSSSETSSRSAVQEIPRVLWNPKFQYKSQPLDRTTSQLKRVHVLTTFLCKVHFKTTLPSTLN